MMSVKTWDDIYTKENFAGTWYPNEEIVRFTARYIKRRIGIDDYDIRRNVKRILDAGCGNGRHVVFFAEQGFDVYGIDISEKGIEITKKWLDKKGLQGNLRVGDISELSFDDEYFDVVISTETLDHVYFSKAKQIMKEIKRVLILGGYAYITLRSTRDSEFGKGTRVANNTFVLQDGYEKGLIQHYFNIEEITELCKGFKIVDLELHESKLSNIYNKTFCMDLKDSRWYFTLQKRKF